MKKAIRVVSEESPCTNCAYKEIIPCCCCIEYIAWKRKLLRMKGADDLQSRRRGKMKAQDRYYSDDITWCMADCVTDCPRQPKYIRDNTIPHSYSDFSKNCMGYQPKETDDE